MKKILLFVSFFLLVFPFATFALVSPTKEFYVNDYANVLDKELEDYIVSNSSRLDKETGAQIVVVTVKDLEGKDLETYATEVFRRFGIGDSKKNNGLLLLLAISERQSRVEVGYGLEGILPDGKTGRMQDEFMIPYYKDNKFSEGLKQGYQAFFNEVANNYDVEGVAEAVAGKNSASSETYQILIQLFFIVLMVIIGIALRGHGIIFFGGGGGFGGGFGGSSGIVFLEGPSLVIDPNNEALIEYLLASVVTDYVDRNCNEVIDLAGFSGKLESFKPQYTASYPSASTSCDMSVFFDTVTDKFTPTIFQVLSFHNHKQGSCEYLEKYRQNALITPVVLDEAFERSFGHSNSSYQYVLRYGPTNREKQ